MIALQVAGAFHTTFMASAIPALERAATGIEISDPVRRIWTNADGSEITDGAKYVELLVSQVANPVRWDACMTSFQESGISGLIELSPAGALTGIAKRALKGVPAVAIKSPEDLDTAVAMIAESA